MRSLEDGGDGANPQVAGVDRDGHGAPIRMAKTNMTALGPYDGEARALQSGQESTGRDPWDPRLMS